MLEFLFGVVVGIVAYRMRRRLRDHQPRVLELAVKAGPTRRRLQPDERDERGVVVLPVPGPGAPWSQ